MKIRRATPSDQARLESLFQSTFCDSAGPDEGAMLKRLVADLGQTQPADDLQVYVIEDDSGLAAAIFFSRLKLDQDQVAFLLAPVAVATAYQGRGLGQQLIRHGIDQLGQQGAELLCTYGDPAFYGKVGFRTLSEATLKAPYPLSQPEGWLALPLQEGVLDQSLGTCRCVAAFQEPGYW